MSNNNGHVSKYALAFGALGVVFGDIGTSPLYALKETFFGHHPLARTESDVLGVLSLFFWSLTLVVTIKYVVLILRADNQGEGGDFAILSILRELKFKSTLTKFILTIIVLGVCFVFADGLITPAISVLSAVEGLKIVTPAFDRYVIPITLTIIICLFLIQKHGTDTISKFFGPIMLTWFIVLIVMAFPLILSYPKVFLSINPYYALNFLYYHGFSSMLVMGSVVLCITGGEALYADMGHFGRGPIRIAWFSLVYPALFINYLGQGAKLLSGDLIPGDNLFFSLVPEWGLLPMVILATAATIIASQALITGVYSLTQQAIGLGYFPRMKITHTSKDMHGQIYMPAVNWMMMIGCIGIVLGFKTSTNLAAAYGITVTATMAISTIGFYCVAVEKWGWSKTIFFPLCFFFLIIDLAFFTSNALKFLDGGFVPVILAFTLFGIMSLWSWGRNRLSLIYKEENISLAELLSLNGIEWRGRIPSRIIFFSPAPVINESSSIPLPLQTFVSRFHMLPQTMSFITVKVLNVPYVTKADKKIEHYDLPEGIHSVVLNFGYMEEINLSGVLETEGFVGNILVGDHEIIPGSDKALVGFGTRLFRQMLRLSFPTYRYFGLKGQSKIIKEIIPVKFTDTGAMMLDVE